MFILFIEGGLAFSAESLYYSDSLRVLSNDSKTQPRKISFFKVYFIFLQPIWKKEHTKKTKTKWEHGR